MTPEDTAEFAPGEEFLAQVGAIADEVTQLIRNFNAIKSRITAPQEFDLGGIFLLVRLVKEGPRRATELAELMLSDPSTVSRQVAALVKSGLVERQSDPADGRASILVPTAAGRERVNQHNAAHGHALSPVLSHWSEEDRTHFVRLLDSYNQGFEQHRQHILSCYVSAATRQLLHPSDGQPLAEQSPPAPQPPLERSA